MNVGTRDIIFIKNLSKMIAKFIDYRGQIIFDKHLLMGPLKRSRVFKIYKLGWAPKIKFKDGLNASN